MAVDGIGACCTVTRPVRADIAVATAGSYASVLAFSLAAPSGSDARAVACRVACGPDGLGGSGAAGGERGRRAGAVPPARSQLAGLGATDCSISRCRRGHRWSGPGAVTGGLVQDGWPPRTPGSTCCAHAAAASVAAGGARPTIEPLRRATSPTYALSRFSGRIRPHSRRWPRRRGRHQALPRRAAPRGLYCTVCPEGLPRGLASLLNVLIGVAATFSSDGGGIIRGYAGHPENPPRS